MNKTSIALLLALIIIAILSASLVFPSWQPVIINFVVDRVTYLILWIQISWVTGAISATTVMVTSFLSWIGFRKWMHKETTEEKKELGSFADGQIISANPKEHTA